MAGKTLELDDVITKDQMGCSIANDWHRFNTLRQQKITDWEEVRKYVYATDTTQTSNSTLPWKNNTTIPKTCQIRDNLHANYMSALFPKRKWVIWEGDDMQSQDRMKKEGIENYAYWFIERGDFKDTVSRLLYDWIDNGNCFAYPEWSDRRVTVSEQNREQAGFVGPVIRRVSPIDIVFNPIAMSFSESPKIVRSIVTLGDVKKLLNSLSTTDNADTNKALFDYMISIRDRVSGFAGELTTKDMYFQMDGFDSFQAYLQSDYVELLTFYGDIYDREKDQLYENYIVTVVDRHKVLDMRPNPSVLAESGIQHAGWRLRQDNLWAMGPLDNLIGMQYRIDHIENLKADVFDLITYPVLKIKGFVEDFEWGPLQRIYVGDDGDVEMLVPDFNVLNANLEISQLELKMEEMAGSPREAMGFRTPGEKTAYEVQRMENAASRIFLHKLRQFSEFLEKLLNGMMEQARRKMDNTTIRVFDDELKFTSFKELSANDIGGVGRLRPVAASHFAERAEKVQNATAFFNSSVGMDPAVNVHFSGLQVANMFEDLIDLTGYKLVTPFIRITEQADAQRLSQAQGENVMMEAQTPSGLTADDATAQG